MKDLTMSDKQLSFYGGILTVYQYTPQQVRTNFVTIPGVSGVTDMTEYVAGKPLFDPAKLTFAMYFPMRNKSNYEAVLAVLNLVNGQKIKMHREDDLKAYTGRCAISKMEQEGKSITISGTMTILEEVIA